MRTITPSCINEVMNCKASVTPIEGMLGTMFVGSDRYTVVCASVKSPKHIKIFEHIPSVFTDKRLVDDEGIEMLPADVLSDLIEWKTPTLEKCKRYVENAQEEFEFQISRFEKEGNYSLRKNGRWMPEGSDAWGTCAIHWGVGDKYIDPDF